MRSNRLKRRYLMLIDISNNKRLLVNYTVAIASLSQPGTAAADSMNLDPTRQAADTNIIVVVVCSAAAASQTSPRAPCIGDATCEEVCISAEDLSDCRHT